MPNTLSAAAPPAPIICRPDLLIGFRSSSQQPLGVTHTRRTVPGPHSASATHVCPASWPAAANATGGAQGCSASSSPSWYNDNEARRRFIIYRPPHNAAPPAPCLKRALPARERRSCRVDLCNKLADPHFAAGPVVLRLAWEEAEAGEGLHLPQTSGCPGSTALRLLAGPKCPSRAALRLPPPARGLLRHGTPGSAP